MKKFFLFIILCCFQIGAFAQTTNKGLNFILELLTADSVTAVNDVNQYTSVYQNILNQAVEKTSVESENYYKHKKLFKLLHSTSFSKYNEQSTISLLFNKKEYNCVTATCLYYAICLDLKLDVTLNESPYHVYLSMKRENKSDIIIDLTDPVDGFDNKKDIDDCIADLLKYKEITIEELNKKGKEQIYNEYISKSEKIKEDKLLAVYYTNLACFASDKDDLFNAYRFAKKAYNICRDSVITETYEYRWGRYCQSIENDLDKCNPLLLETLSNPLPSADFEKTILDVSYSIIENNLRKGNVLIADSTYRKLLVFLSGNKKENPKVIELGVDVELQVIRNKLLRGNYEESYSRIKTLYRKDKGNSNVQDIYIYAAALYIKEIALTNDLNKMIDIADTMYHDMPEVKTVQDMYIGSKLEWAFLDDSDTARMEKAKTILFDFKKNDPENILLKKYVSEYYHKLAMVQVRKNNYNKAFEIVNEGLTYDKADKDLKSDLNDIKGFLNNKTTKYYKK